MKWAVLCSVLVAFCGWLLITRSTNNVCKTFEDYYTDRDSNDNCHYNPDVELKVPDIVKRHGYPIETHEVTTEDGYILTLFRIPHGKGSPQEKPRKPVLLNHCWSTNSVIYVYTGKKSLAFILADAGYDVWLGNLRGSMYSRKHTHLNETDTKYWDFSFHEMGLYDIPTQTNFINGITKQKIIHIGYLLSSTASFIYGSSLPEAALRDVKMFINLSPPVFLDKSAFGIKILGYIWSMFEMLPLKTLTNGRIFPIQPLPPTLHKFFCFPFPFQMKMCQFLEQWLFGLDYEQYDPETLPVTLQATSDAGSIKTASHSFQLVFSGNFQHFDYGVEENQRLYGNPEPKNYNLSNFRVPTYLVAAENDLLVTRENVETLYEALPNEVKKHRIYVINHKKFNHLDFIKAKDVVSLLYEPLVSFMNTL